MESTLLAAPATMSLVALSKSVNSNSVLSVCHFWRRFATNRASQIVLLSRIARAHLRNGGDPSRFGSSSLRNSLKSGDLQPVRWEVRSVSGSAASFAAGGGGNDGLSGNGGGGGGDAAERRNRNLETRQRRLFITIGGRARSAGGLHRAAEAATGRPRIGEALEIIASPASLARKKKTTL
nr:copper-transporting ATPase PAA1, chloroplastic [Ipomoea batatas]